MARETESLRYQDFPVLSDVNGHVEPPGSDNVIIPRPRYRCRERANLDLSVRVVLNNEPLVIVSTGVENAENEDFALGQPLAL